MGDDRIFIQGGGEGRFICDTPGNYAYEVTLRPFMANFTDCAENCLNRF